MPSSVLNKDQIKYIKENYIINRSTILIFMIEDLYKVFEKDFDNHKQFSDKFKRIYEESKNLDSKSLTYDGLTSFVYEMEVKDSEIENTGEAISFFTGKMRDELKVIFEDKEKSGTLMDDDEKSIKVIFKAIQHLELANIQKNSLNNQFRTDLEETKHNLEKQEKKYEKMTIDYLSMMGIFSTIIFAVFGGLTQIASLGQNLFKTPIYKVLVYVSLTSISLLLIVFLCFNAISSMTKYNLRSCCNDNDCNHSLKRRHPTVWYGVVFFIELLTFGFIIKLSNYQVLVNQISVPFQIFVTALLFIVFMVMNAIFVSSYYKRQN